MASCNPFSSIKMNYFPIQGAAEPARLALVLGEIPFEDARLDRPAMTAMKEAGELPYGQLPTLVVDGKTIAQSDAIAKLCAKIAGLTPTDLILAAKVDEISQFIFQDCRDRVIAPSMRETDEAKKAAMRAEIAAKLLPEKLAFLESQVGPSGYLVGDGITMADIQFYCMANWVGMGNLDGIPKEVFFQFPKLTALVRTMNENPLIKKWNAEKNPTLPWC